MLRERIAAAGIGGAKVSVADGEIGVEGMIAFLSESRFEGLPAILEGPGRSGKEIEPVDIAWAFDLRSRGLAERLSSA